MKFRTAFFVSAALVALIPFTSFTGSGVEKETASPKIIFTPDTSDTRKVIINDQYSLMIPKNMKATKDLNDEASLQYQNTTEELYIIVIDEPAGEFVNAYKKSKGWDPGLTTVENYRKVQLAALKKAIKRKGKPTIQKATVNGDPMEIVDFTGVVPGITYPIFYKIGFIESGKNLYMIMTWTFAERKALHNRAMEEMVRSFKSEGK
jgi:hypothetical protein